MSKEANIISAKNKTGFDVWNPPEVSGRTINADEIDARKITRPSSVESGPVTAQNLEEIRKAAYQEGLEKGKAEGRASALLEQQKLTTELSTILENCHRETSHFEQQVCEQLVSITIAVAKQIIRRELSTEPEHIMAVIREAIGCLPTSSEKLILKLHPDDAALVREIYNLDEEPDRIWTIFEDPGLHRGGCIINSESSVVNADLDSRIAMIVRSVNGGR